MSAIISFIKANFWSIGLSSVVPALIWVVVGAGMCLIILRYARRRGWLEGRLRTVLSMLLLLNVVFIVIPGFIFCGGVSAAARRAVVLLGEKGTGDPAFDTSLRRRLGEAVLAPVLGRYASQGTIGQDTELRTDVTAFDPLLLGDKTAVDSLLRRIDAADLDAYAWYTRRQLGEPKTRLPSRLSILILDLMHTAYVASLDVYPDLLSTVPASRGEGFSLDDASTHIGTRLLAKHGRMLVDRALGTRPQYWGMLLVLQFIILLVICRALAWCSRPSA